MTTEDTSENTTLTAIEKLAEKLANDTDVDTVAENRTQLFHSQTTQGTRKAEKKVKLRLSDYDRRRSGYTPVKERGTSLTQRPTHCA